MNPARIIVADDDKDILATYRKILEHEGYEITTASNAAAVLGRLKSSSYDLVLIDYKMPGVDGLEAITLMRNADPMVAIVMITAYASLETAVSAVKRGAFDYLAKPFTAGQLQVVVKRALEQKHLVDENLNLREQLTASLGFDRILGISSAMQKVFWTLQRVMRTDASILLQGETGTGKELVARTIHAHSYRMEKPFVAVDCAALPDHLLESELFGHEKGAFTGAEHSTKGLLELADTGTLLLDEVGEIPLNLQAKLLRTLQEREFRRLGSEKLTSVDLRVIAATSRDLRSEVAQKKFREELYYRLNVVTVHLPPLRERREDVPLLAKHFLESFSRGTGRPANTLSPGVMKLLMEHQWPGNVRELQNALQYSSLVAQDGVIATEDLPEYLQPQAETQASFRGMRESHAEAIEKPFLTELLRKHKGNVTEAAADAQMTRKMFYRAAKKLRIDLDEYRGESDPGST